MEVAAETAAGSVGKQGRAAGSMGGAGQGKPGLEEELMDLTATAACQGGVQRACCRKPGGQGRGVGGKAE
eukprot:1093353-Pelagomonas_calceolata.AAC.7